MVEGSSKALDDVKPPAEEEVILDFYEETSKSEPSIVVFSEGGFVIWICIFFLTDSRPHLLSLRRWMYCLKPDKNKLQYVFFYI